jgi:hypothetical protein
MVVDSIALCCLSRSGTRMNKVTGLKSKLAHTENQTGYAARVSLNANPWNTQAFETQICAIILGPTLVCISIYLTLKHVCLALNPTLSRIRPALYPFVFVPLDTTCLLIQAIGGALAAGATNTDVPKLTLLKAGNNMIIAGIALQVVVLLGFGAVCGDLFLRFRNWLGGGGDDGGDEAGRRAAASALWKNSRFRMFLGAVAGAYACVLIRCIYR